jgi:hypothetical protein
LTYDVAHWGRIEPNGENPQAIARAWNAHDELSLYVGTAEIYPGGLVRCENGENGLDGPDATDHVAGLSRTFPRALFGLVSEGEDFGDFPYVTYAQNGRWYSEPFAVPGFDPARLRALPDTTEHLVQQMMDEERFGGPNLGMRVEDMEPYDPGDV